MTVRKQLGYTLTEIIVVLLIMFGGGGWVWNIVKIASADFSDITGMLILRIIGIFVAPLGAVLGYL